MLFRELRTGTVFNLALLLMVAMTLIELVTLAGAQKQLIRAEAERARLAVSMAARSLVQDGRLAIDSGSLSEAVRIAGPLCASVVGSLHGERLVHGAYCSGGQELFSLAEGAAGGTSATSFSGTTWGVFWQAPRQVATSAPLERDGRRLGGMAMVFDLEPVYANLRGALKVFIVYIGVNALVLTALGYHLLSRLYLRPLRRMARSAEGYREDGDLPFGANRQGNELTGLANALNRMLRRIARDKEDLRDAVRRLECANTDLRQAREEVVRAEKLSTVGRLASGIAHEIGNPVGIVLGYLELLKRADVCEEEKRDYISRCEKEIGRVSAVIRQLLDFSRPSACAPELVSVHAALGEVADMLRVQPAMSGIDFEMRAHAQADTVCADPDQLRQVLLNIVLNAADAIAERKDGPGGRLLLSTRVVDARGPLAEAPPNGSPGRPMLAVVCEDNVIGIPADQLGNIFDPFFTTKGPGRGTGLGLSVSYMLVKRMGGRMEAVSEPGLGTTLSLVLPLHGPDSGDAAPGPAEPSPAG